MNKLNFAIGMGLCAIMISSSAISAEQGEWVVRLGPALIEPTDNTNDEVDGIPDSDVRVDNDFTLGFTIGYMLTDNFAIELLGVTPGQHDLQGAGSIGGLGEIGSVDVFPPTLSLQYHLNTSSRFKPFVGIGLNYTHFRNERASSSLEAALGGETDIDIDDSFGIAGHVGVDYAIDDSWLVNATVWYIDIEAEAELSTAGAGDRDVDIDIDPWVFLLSIGKTF